MKLRPATKLTAIAIAYYFCTIPSIDHSLQYDHYYYLLFHRLIYHDHSYYDYSSFLLSRSFPWRIKRKLSVAPAVIAVAPDIEAESWTLSASTAATSATDNGTGTGHLSTGVSTNILQLLQKETELHEKTRKEHQHERKNLQAKLAMMVKANSKKREKTVVEEKWDIVRVIPTAEEQIPCRNSKTCSKNTEVSWASNLNPEDSWDLCEDC